jgi:hypothetical protein
MTVFGTPGTLPAEFKCSKCGVRWFVDEPTPWGDAQKQMIKWTTEATDGIGTQMGIDIPGEST